MRTGTGWEGVSPVNTLHDIPVSDTLPPAGKPHHAAADTCLPECQLRTTRFPNDVMIL
jgi:hypothetical protein